MKTLLVTGGAGFIGANFVLQAISDGLRVVNLDKRHTRATRTPCPP